mmetsp:Transcript_24869/g.71921  ORF Transcript_24869/g.71921 Transcript_24869/m.71921 type:complete len:325 (-) Transcript_24869:587-1561(-)
MTGHSSGGLGRSLGGGLAFLPLLNRCQLFFTKTVSIGSLGGPSLLLGHTSSGPSLGLGGARCLLRLTLLLTCHGHGRHLGSTAIALRASAGSSLGRLLVARRCDGSNCHGLLIFLRYRIERAILGNASLVLFTDRLKLPLGHIEQLGRTGLILLKVGHHFIAMSPEVIDLSLDNEAGQHILLLDAIALPGHRLDVVIVGLGALHLGQVNVLVQEENLPNALGVREWADPLIKEAVQEVLPLGDLLDPSAFQRRLVFGLELLPRLGPMSFLNSVSLGPVRQGLGGTAGRSLLLGAVHPYPLHVEVGVLDGIHGQPGDGRRRSEGG